MVTPKDDESVEDEPKREACNVAAAARLSTVMLLLMDTLPATKETVTSLSGTPAKAARFTLKFSCAVASNSVMLPATENVALTTWRMA